MTTAIIKPQWSFVTIALMVLGFMFWWPVGLAVLAYIVWGEYLGGSAERAERWVGRQKQWARDCRDRSRNHQRGFANSTGNAAFDDYREEQLKRLDEERRRLDDDIREFHEYMRNLRKARDREEFDRFMADRRTRSQDDRPHDRDHGDGNRQGY